MIRIAGCTGGGESRVFPLFRFGRTWADSMVFVSYSRSEMPAVRALVETLAKQGVECWLDNLSIPVGQAFVNRLGTALREADSFLLVDTKVSRSSYWVWREVQTSRRYRRSKRYHSTMRLYTSTCQDGDTRDWDVSIPLDQRAPSQVARFLASRRPAKDAEHHEGAIGGVEILDDTGLGQPGNWAGRQDELRKLDEWWFGSLPGAWLCGLGGIGKSGLLQTWVTALSSLGYDASVSATVMYLRGRQVDSTQVHHTLSKWESRATSPNRLLLLDGYDEVKDTRETEDILSQAINSGIRAIVTSRTAPPQALTGRFASLSLAGMTRRDGVAILEEFGITGPEAEGLVTEAGYHPLALSLVTRLVATGGKTPNEVLRELRDAREAHSEDVDRLPRTIRALLGRAVKTLSEDAREVLQAFSRSGEHVASPLEAAFPAIRELAQAALVQVDHIEAPTKVSLHPLVRIYLTEKQSAVN